MNFGSCFIFEILFTVSSLGEIHTDVTLDVDGSTTLNGDINLGDAATDDISFPGQVDTDLTFGSGLAVRTATGNLTLNPAGGAAMSGYSVSNWHGVCTVISIKGSRERTG